MIRDFETKDYLMLSQWWDAQEFPKPALGLLPATGYICDEIAAAFLYLTNSPLSWIEWVVADPDAEKQARSHAIDSVINYACNQAKRIESAAVFTTTTNFPFSARLQKLGFVHAHEGIKSNNYFKVI
jgi:hypothetical protein